MALNKIGKSYDYRAICDVCGFKKWSYELRERWDGKMVCREDWEPRNILDFYRTRNDAHRLPFTRPDTEPLGSTWTPSFGGFTISGGFSQVIAGYIQNTTTKEIDYSIVATLGSVPCVVGNGATITLPFSVATDKGGTCRGSKSGVFYSKTTHSGNIIIVTNGFTINPPDSILFTGRFIST